MIAKTQEGKPLPGVAQLGIQSGRLAAANVLRRMAGEQTEKFWYVDRGSMATIGRHRAVAQIGKFECSGVLAWWLWLTVHILALVGFRSRLAVLVEWAWAYASWQRRSRVILEVPVEPMDPRASSYMAGRTSGAFRRAETGSRRALHTSR